MRVIVDGDSGGRGYPWFFISWCLVYERVYEVLNMCYLIICSLWYE